MTRYGGMFGPDVTFLGVPRCDLGDPGSFADADVVVIGAPFDGGTSHRPGCRFGPQAIRITDYLPHDGSRPHLALRVDPLKELRVLDGGDVEMPPGDIDGSLERLADVVHRASAGGAIPVVLGGDHSIAYSDVTGVARTVGWGRRQLLDAVRRICLELPVVGMDVVEVAPPYDPAEVTAYLANRVVLEALSGICARRKGLRHDPAGPLLQGRS